MGHFGLGIATAGLAVLLASNAKTNFLSGDLTLIVAILAAIFSALSTLIHAQTRADTFGAAARELEKSIELYRVDTTLEPRFLAEAVVRAIGYFSPERPRAA